MNRLAFVAFCLAVLVLFVLVTEYEIPRNKLKTELVDNKHNKSLLKHEKK